MPCDRAGAARATNPSVWPQHEVFLVDAIEKGRTDKMPHLKAVYFVRPSPENIRLLQARAMTLPPHRP